MTFIIPLGVLGLLGLAMGIGLGLASKKFAVQTDSRLAAVIDLLPGANCGACGFPGCSGYARALISGNTKSGLCPASGEETTRKISEILGIEADVSQKKVAVIKCGGDVSSKRHKGVYEGVKTCLASSLVGGGHIMCDYGCLGFGDCVLACPFGAIENKSGKPPEINPEKCTGCGICVKTCPKNLIELIPSNKYYYVACSSKDKAKIVKQVCDSGCIGCGICARKCPNQALSIENNLSKMDYEKCLNAGECLKACPTKCIKTRK